MIFDIVSETSKALKIRNEISDKYQYRPICKPYCETPQIPVYFSKDTPIWLDFRKVGNKRKPRISSQNRIIYLQQHLQNESICPWQIQNPIVQTPQTVDAQFPMSKQTKFPITCGRINMPIQESQRTQNLISSMKIAFFVSNKSIKT